MFSLKVEWPPNLPTSITPLGVLGALAVHFPMETIKLYHPQKRKMVKER